MAGVQAAQHSGHSGGVGRRQRFSRQRRCPICGGYDDPQRSKGRCYGYLSFDLKYAYCTNVPSGSGLTYRDSDAYAHYMIGPCDCGLDHGDNPAKPVIVEGGPLSKLDIMNWDQADERYDYQNPDGSYLFSVLRWNVPGGGKIIRQGVQGEDGKWSKSLEFAGVQKPYPLYRASEVAACDGAVFVVEGEKCCNKLNAVLSKAVATTSVGGAKKSHNTDWGPVEGKTVIVLPDNDDDGRIHALQVSEECLKVGARSVRVVDLPGLKPKGDIADWLEEGHTIEDLRSLVRGTLPQVRLTVIEGSRDIVPGQLEGGIVAEEEVEGEHQWEEPIDLGTWSNLEKFPVEVLPPWLKNMVLEVARESQTAPCMAGMVALSVLSCALAGKVFVWPWAGRKDEPVVLYTMTCAEPGGGKSTVHRYLTAPVYAWESDEVERLGTAAVEAEGIKLTLEQSLKQTRDLAAKKLPGDAERPMLLSAVAELEKELATLVIPSASQKIADDTTSEALTRLLSQNKGIIALMSDEGDVLDNIAGRYSGAPRLGPYKKGYDGSQIRINRVGRGTEIIPRPCITIGVMPQYSVVMGLGKVKQLQGEGLLDRFIFSLPEDLRGHRKRDQPPVGDDVITAYNDHVRALLDLEVPQGEEGTVTTIPFSPEAEALFRSFEDGIVERGMLNPEIYGQIPGWASKFAGKVARISGLLHCAELIETNPHPWEVPISSRTMRKAMAIGKHAMSQARAAFDLLKAEATMNDAITTLNWLRDYVAEGRGTVVTQRSLWHPFRGRYKKPAEFIPVVETLVTNGFLRQLSDSELDEHYHKHIKRGRKPEACYDINPLWLSKTMHRASRKQADWDTFTNWDAEDDGEIADGGFLEI